LADGHREEIGEIKRAADHSANLSRQLLTFARRQNIAPRQLDLSETVSGTLRMLRRLIGEDIELVHDPCKAPAMVLIDPNQVDQVLANLVVNASDAIDGPGRITIETSIARFNEAYCRDHPDFAAGPYAVLAVSDDGAGMTAETAANVFEPFFTTKPREKGTGLGLSTVYGIVKQNGGFIHVYSEPGQGTTFRLYFPLQVEPSQAVREQLAQPAPPTGHEAVLLVEDEPSLLALSRRLLERLGYRVLAAGSAAEALNLAGANGGVDLLMTDVVMPEMNGRDLYERLAQDQPGLRCLFMSGYTAEVVSGHRMLSEGVHFLQKPFSLNDLARKVREVLN
jgi:CheY-like chemotaxis protein